MLGVLARNPLFKERLGNLETITLNGLCIEDTDFLRHCSFKLTNLDLSGNLLHQLPQALPQLRNLCSLHLDENQLQLDRSMLRPTLELPELQSLSVFGNPAPTDFPIVAMGRQKGENVLRRLRKEVLLPPPMIQIPGGTFGMGQPDPTIVTHYDGINTLYSDNEQPVHLVMLSDFCLGKYAVTLGEFRIFIEETRYLTSAERNGEGSYIWDVNRRTVDLLPGVNWRHDAHGKPQTNERHPVLHVSWYDAVAFCNWLSRREGLQEVYQMGPGQGDINNSGKSSTADWMVSVNRDANGYRLPTEAEWEFAARERGREVLFGNGKNIANPAEINFNGRVESEYSVTGEYRERTVPVGSLQPNALLLYEMSGNVGEWCQDWYGDYSPSAQTNPQGPDTGSGRVIRGGSWIDGPQNCRVAVRSSISPGFRDSGTGFRLSRTL
jgi:formylglycine-generating enzyme required for sulfatase activity